MDFNFQLLGSYKNFKPRGYLDIGANTGEFARIMLKTFPVIENVLLIEANENCSKHLEKLHLNYKICLLSDSEKTLDYYMSPKSPTGTGNSYFRENTPWYSDVQPVQKSAITLDKALSSYKCNFDLIKVDTQGSELDILKGAIETLTKARYIILECSADHSANYNSGAPKEKDINEYLRSFGFSHSYTIFEHIWRKKEELIPGISYGKVFQKDVLFSRGKMVPSVKTYFLLFTMFAKKIILKALAIVNI